MMNRKDWILALALPKQNMETISSPHKQLLPETALEHIPSSPRTAHKPSSPETAHKPSSPETAHKPSSPETAHKPSAPRTALKLYSREVPNVPYFPDTASSHAVSSSIQIPPLFTDITATWSRPYDFSDYKCIFDYKNEYRNSFDIVKDIDTTLFSKPQIQTTPVFASGSLFCNESMPSDEEESNPSVDFYDDSDDSVKDKNYKPPVHKKKKKFNTGMVLQLPLEDFDPISQVVVAEVHKTPVASSQICHNDLPRLIYKRTLQEQPSDEIEVVKEVVEAVESGLNTDALSETEIIYTKSGAPRKRRKFNTPLSQRVQEKKQKDDAKLNLKEPCTEKCRIKCTNKISPEERQNIHDRYINLNWEARGLFIKGLIEPINVKMRTVKDNNNLSPKRSISYKYKFFVNQVKIEVCKTYFLTTLGYHPQNSTHVYRVLEKPVDEQKDKRGSYERKNVIDKDVIRTHIKSYNPVVSHYRREHAPLKLYLPSDVTIKLMQQNFTETYPNIKASFETYRRVLRELNISFAHLGNEECEQCALFKSHQHSNECSQNQSCEKCLLYHKHNLRYKTIREAYKTDVSAASTDKETVYYSVDLQKVIMLPRMDQYKIAIFCPRIIAFNESFVPLGKTKDDKLPFAVLWNETISGRNQEDILSAFRCFLLHTRDAKHVVIWADNCAAQNKNWAFMCFLINMINSNLTATETITIKYFEPGHSFMSADHFHHQVEMSLKKKNKVYDFNDFVDAVQNANSRKNKVHVMSVADFFIFEDSSSQHKLRNIEPRVYLRDIISVKAEKGNYTIKFKEKLESEWKELDFLQVKVKKSKIFPNAVSKSVPRGIAKERKQEIISKLVPLMPENRRLFWTTLPESTKTLPNLHIE